MPVNLTLIGISHHRAPIELRERVALDLDGCRLLANRLGPETVVLSTCNRTEFYLAGPSAGGDEVLALLARLAGDRREQLEAVLYRLEGEAAELHLFRVAAGLDSSVPGEGEILGQVRAAVEAGAPGPFLDRLFRQALRAGRRVRLDTAIGESPASVPSAAAAYAHEVLGDLTGRGVLLLGAGKMSESTARNLLARGARVVAVANRTLEHGEQLAAKLGARALALDAAVRELPHVDIVVSSTSAPGLVLSGHTVAATLTARGNRPLLLVDLAVPRDVDPAIADLEGCVVCNVDDLEAVVATTLTGRRTEAARAEQLIAAEASRFREWQASLDVVPTIVSLRARAEEIREQELDRIRGRLSDDERRQVEAVTSKILARLLHLPTVRMKEAAAAADGMVVNDVVRHLFGLEEQPGR
jgi:glutamyl-tRNA reductase